METSNCENNISHRVGREGYEKTLSRSEKVRHILENTEVISGDYNIVSGRGDSMSDFL